MADSKDRKIPEVPHLENIKGDEKIPVSADGQPGYIETSQIYDKEVTPYPKANEIIYTTTDGEIIELDDANIVSNVYYKDKGFGVIVCNGNYVPLFTEKSTLRSIFIGDNFNTLKINAFKLCTNLYQVNLPKTINALPNYSFQSCSSLKIINLENIIYYHQSVLEGTAIESIEFAEGSVLSGDKHLAKCPYLTRVILSDSMTQMPSTVGCSSLNYINIPSSLDKINAVYFDNCTNLLNFDINGLLTHVTSLSPYALQNTCFDNITIPSNCKTLGTACLNTKRLKYLTISQGVEDISYCMYNSRIILEKLTLPSSLTNIQNAFDRTYAKCIDSSLPWIKEFPLINYLETLILRSKTLVEDIEEYVTTFHLEEGQEIPEGAIQSRTNLDTYIGTPNNWLRIYVPNNLLKAYQERYPTLKSHFHPIQGEDIYAMREEVDEKLKEIQGGVSVTEDDFQVKEMRVVEVEDSENSNGNSNGGSGGEGDVYVLPEEILQIIEDNYWSTGRYSVSAETINTLHQALKENKKPLLKYLSGSQGFNGYVECYPIYILLHDTITANFYLIYNLDGSEFLSLSYHGDELHLNWMSYELADSYSLLTNPLARTSIPTIQAGKQYYNEIDNLTIFNFDGFNSNNKTATILSSKPITFEGDNVLTPAEVPNSNYILYKIEYMQISDDKYVLVVTATAMNAPIDGLKGIEITNNKLISKV